MLAGEGAGRQHQEQWDPSQIEPIADRMGETDETPIPFRNVASRGRRLCAAASPAIGRRDQPPAWDRPRTWGSITTEHTLVFLSSIIAPATPGLREARNPA